MVEFEPIAQKYAREIAALHIEGIGTGFISSLGIDFVTALYEAISEDKSSFGLVAEEDRKVVGFVAFTTNINRLYKSVIFRKGIRFALMLAGKVFSFSSLKKIIVTLFYPARIKKLELPRAELLSIVVAKEAQGKGLGRQLLQKGLAECAKRKIDEVKVLVGADNKPANELYQKCGLKLVGKINNHGILSNVYVADTTKKYTK